MQHCIDNESLTVFCTESGMYDHGGEKYEKTTPARLTPTLSWIPRPSPSSSRRRRQCRPSHLPNPPTSSHGRSQCRRRQRDCGRLTTKTTLTESTGTSTKERDLIWCPRTTRPRPAARRPVPALHAAHTATRRTPSATRPAARVRSRACHPGGTHHAATARSARNRSICSE